MKKKYKIALFVAVAVLVWAGLLLSQEFRFYNLESNDIFLFDRADIWGKLKMPGGLALVVASFLTQFMGIPYVGVSVTTALYLLAGWVIFMILRRIRPGMAMAGLSLLPVAFMFLCLENDYFRFYGHVAFVMALLALWGYVSVDDWRKRLAAGVVAVPLMYLFAGSAAVVFAVSAAVYEIFMNGYKGLWALAFPALMLLTAFICLNAALVGSWETALTPFMYYNYPSTYFFPTYAWVCVPLLIVAAWAASKMDFHEKPAMIVAAAGLVLSFFVAVNIYGKVHSTGNYRFLQEQRWVDKGDWDRIIETADRRQPTFLISYLNLALAQKGQLVERFRYFNPQPLNSLMLPMPNLKNGLTLQSHVYLSWGYVGPARKAAFDGNQVTAGLINPRQMKVLVRTNLVLGAYDVAEKYIMILEKTLFYRGWASSMRKFLNNPEAVKSDEFLGELHASLPLTDKYAREDGIAGDMKDILDVNPDNRILSQFYELYQILEATEWNGLY